MNAIDISKATPRPWTADSNEIRCHSGVLAECYGQVCIEEEWHPSIEAKANAALIVQAINEYDALIAIATAADVALAIGQVTGNSKSNLTRAITVLADIRKQNGAA